MRKIINPKRICLLIVFALFGAGGILAIGHFLGKHDPKWQAVNEIFKVQTALKEVDENWKMESLSEVRPYEIKQQNGPSIYYYCCVSSYLNGEDRNISGLNQMAISQIVDVDRLENSIACDVNGLEAILGEQGNKKYLCWTLTPEYSCVLEYTIGAVSEEDIFHIAETIELPEQ